MNTQHHADTPNRTIRRSFRGMNALPAEQSWQGHSAELGSRHKTHGRRRRFVQPLLVRILVSLSGCASQSEAEAWQTKTELKRSGNHFGLHKAVTPNSIPLLKPIDLPANLNNATDRILFSPDAKVAMNFDNDENEMILTFRALRPTPDTSVKSGGLLSIANLEANSDNVSISMPIELWRGADTASRGIQLKIRQAPFQGHLAIDPRYSEGLPFRVRRAGHCFDAEPFRAANITSATGKYECYRFIHFQTFS